MLKNYNENNEQMVGGILFKEDKEKINRWLRQLGTIEQERW